MCVGGAVVLYFYNNWLNPVMNVGSPALRHMTECPLPLYCANVVVYCRF